MEFVDGKMHGSHFFFGGVFRECVEVGSFAQNPPCQKNLGDPGSPSENGFMEPKHFALR